MTVLSFAITVGVVWVAVYLYQTNRLLRQDLDDATQRGYHSVTINCTDKACQHGCWDVSYGRGWHLVAESPPPQGVAGWIDHPNVQNPSYVEDLGNYDTWPEHYWKVGTP